MRHIVALRKKTCGRVPTPFKKNLWAGAHPGIKKIKKEPQLEVVAPDSFVSN
jgi:hypothetical protein